MPKPKGPIKNPYAAGVNDEKGSDVLTLLYATPEFPTVQQENQGTEEKPNVEQDTPVLPATAYGMERAGNVVMIPWDIIDPDENNFFSQDEIEELAENIAEYGLQHNCVVRPTEDGRFKLISGHRRWAACKYLSQIGNSKFDRIMCQVLEVDALEGEIMLIYDNQQTRTITPMERIKSVERLTDLIAQKRAQKKIKGKTRDLVGQIIGISGVEVGRIQRIRENLMPDLLTALDKGVITFRSAIDLSGKPKENQEKILKKVAAAEVLSTNDVSKLIQKAEGTTVHTDENIPNTENNAEAMRWITSIDKYIAAIKRQCADYTKLREADAGAIERIQTEAIRACCDLSIAWYDLVQTLGADNIEYLFADTLEHEKAAAGEPITEEEEDRAIKILHSMFAHYKTQTGKEIPEE